MTDGEAQRTGDAHRLVEQVLSAYETALVAEDLTDIVERSDVHHHVPSPSTDLAAALIEVEGLVPSTLVVGIDAEVIEHRRLADEVTELFVDRQRETAVALRVGMSHVGHRPVEQVVDMRERGQVTEALGL